MRKRTALDRVMRTGVAAALTLAVPVTHGAQVVAYETDFTPVSTRKREADKILSGMTAAGVSYKWMIADETDDEPIGVDRTPSGNFFLGHHQNRGDRMDELGMDNHIVSFDLAGLEAHQGVTLQFDLYAIHEWDGDDGGVRGMPDYFGVSVDDGGVGRTLALSTFSNVAGKPQSYPGGLFAQFPGGFDAGSGAFAVDTLGYDRNGGSYDGFADAIYRFEFTFDHTASDLALSFFASVNDVMKESWGLDNVRVTLNGVGAANAAPVPAPAPLLLLFSGVGVSLLGARRRRAGGQP